MFPCKSSSRDKNINAGLRLDVYFFQFFRVKYKTLVFRKGGRSFRVFFVALDQTSFSIRSRRKLFLRVVPGTESGYSDGTHEGGCVLWKGFNCRRKMEARSSLCANQNDWEHQLTCKLMIKVFCFRNFRTSGEGKASSTIDAVRKGVVFWLLERKINQV